ncbi:MULTISPECIES: amino acid ABC transporter ATP-binding protein [Corynebacterium]|uniref:amino acid ABC transporter ATP-binding protein n=1 Tax=Corynebacterium sp. MSK006 TaxID=3050187 RepID=UPI003014F11B
MAHAITVDRVSKSFGERRVLDEISFVQNEGEVVCLLGASGSGKSTLLRCINRLEVIDSGRIEVFGDLLGYEPEGVGSIRISGDGKLAIDRQSVGMVFQKFNLFPHKTALENVMEAPVCVLKKRKEDARKDAIAELKKVGLEDFAGHYPDQLSGGQQQRVAIARAMAMGPRLMLLDEPTSALDPELVGEVLAVIRQLAEEGMTMLIVTHQIEFAREVADTVIYLDGGKIAEQGPADQVIDNAKSDRARRFFAAARQS